MVAAVGITSKADQVTVKDTELPVCSERILRS
jgi:hypothetical protein